MGAGAATVLETELTAASIRHNLKAYPRATHVFFDDQLRACHLAAAAGTRVPRVDAAIPRLPSGMVSGTDNERGGEHCHREPRDQQGRGSGRMAVARGSRYFSLFRPAGEGRRYDDIDPGHGRYRDARAARGAAAA